MPAQAPIAPPKSKGRSKAASRFWLTAGAVAGVGVLFYAQDSRAGIHR